MSNILYVNFRSGKVTSMDDVQKHFKHLPKLERIRELNKRIHKLRQELKTYEV